MQNIVSSISSIPAINSADLTNKLQNSFLFEISWEVCNEVGGIYKVLHSKIKTVLQNFNHNNYILIGPLVDNNQYFVEQHTAPFAQIAAVLQAKKINCKVGYWDTDGKPIVILIDFKNRYRIDLLLYNLWADFQIDSLGSGDDYQEPVLFATAAGEVIDALAHSEVVNQRMVIAHAHEWLGGAALLYLKKHCSEISTVFTTHATVLGRSLVSHGIAIDNLAESFDSIAEARNRGVLAKHLLEQATAENTDYFTTVSFTMGEEVGAILDRYPDNLLFDGLDIEAERSNTDQAEINETRRKLIKIASHVAGKLLPENTLIWVTAGRYEFHNKGFDVLLNSLAQLESRLPPDAPPIVVFFLIAVNWHSKQDSLFDTHWSNDASQKNALGIATHCIINPDQDEMIKLSNELNLRRENRKIQIVYSDAYLNGADGVFDIPYKQVLAAADLSIFPSCYEPWGYAPLESVAQGVSTITTDLSGFGNWVHHLTLDYQDAIYVLERKNKSDHEFIAILTQNLLDIFQQNHDVEHRLLISQKALAVAALTDWELFYEEYLHSYYQALKLNKIYQKNFAAIESEVNATAANYAPETLLPRFRTVQYHSPLPARLSELRDFAYNFWWSWNENVKVVFQKINPALWEEVKHNPVHFLNHVSNVALQRAAADKNYLFIYDQVMQAFHQDCKGCFEPIRLCNSTAISDEHPIAYFCMEYGIDECLPVYSGGLGILAGDYLKAMSALKVPFIAIGLFYKQGYFLQRINESGEQVASYRTWNTSHVPMQLMYNANGELLLVSVEVFGKTIYAQVWEVKVGNVRLYLLDTDVSVNASEDRTITNSLYGGSREIRLKQEIVLGIGGTRFILEQLKITPALYHLNEGHSAFLLLERVRQYYHQGMSLPATMELIKNTSVFTTHTPVSAGNEEFSEELIRRYFSYYAVAIKAAGISLEQVFALAHNGSNNFSMTAFALRLCGYVNAVSNLHRKVAQAMWHKIWPTLPEDQVPINYITNGVHLTTWLGQDMQLLYDQHLPANWREQPDEPTVWQPFAAVTEAELWQTHQAQKEKLIALVKDLVLQQYSTRNESQQLITASLNCLANDVLLLGLARRFTSYKRNDLIFNDRERLANILTAEKRPVVLLIAGKAHPQDTGGSDLIHEVIEITRDPKFKGHIIFLEEYNIALAKSLVQGVDVWVNTPILGHEACGTSGMKAGINGGLNFSTKDGWWSEAYNDEIGWEIKSMPSIDDLYQRDDTENKFLLNTLQDDIATLYYNRSKNGFNPAWIKKMKASIALIACHYNTTRMAKEYINQCYCQVVK